jgi:hypothetical protein
LLCSKFGQRQKSLMDQVLCPSLRGLLTKLSTECGDHSIPLCGLKIVQKRQLLKCLKNEHRSKTYIKQPLAIVFASLCTQFSTKVVRNLIFPWCCLKFSQSAFWQGRNYSPVWAKTLNLHFFCAVRKTPCKSWTLPTWSALVHTFIPIQCG